MGAVHVPDQSDEALQFEHEILSRIKETLRSPRDPDCETGRVPLGRRYCLERTQP